MKNSLLQFKISQNLGLILLLVFQLELNTFSAQEISLELIEQELTRTRVDPDQSIEISVNAPLSYVFDFLSLRLNEYVCLLYTSPSPRDRTRSRMPSSA